jgi:hypothetical protein
MDTDGQMDKQNHATCVCLDCLQPAAHLVCKGTVHALVFVAELVGGLAVRDLVVAEPGQHFLELTREVPVYMSTQIVESLNKNHASCLQEQLVHSALADFSSPDRMGSL